MRHGPPGSRNPGRSKAVVSWWRLYASENSRARRACRSRGLLGSRRCRAGGAGRPVFRPKQGGLRVFRFRGAQDGALRHLLLRGERGRRADGRPPRRALVRPPLPGAQPRVPPAPTDHPLRRPSGLRTDEHLRPVHRRGHTGLHGDPEAAARHADDGVASRDRSPARPRTRARLPVRHDGAGDGRPGAGRARRDPAPAVVHRRHGRVPLDRTHRPVHDDVDAGRPGPGGRVPDDSGTR